MQYFDAPGRSLWAAPRCDSHERNGNIVVRMLPDIIAIE
jgi:hypothetical protein